MTFRASKGTYNNQTPSAPFIFSGTVKNVGGGSYEKGLTLTLSLSYPFRTPDPGYKALVRRPLQLSVLAIPKLARNGTWDWKVTIPPHQLPAQGPYTFFVRISNDSYTANNFKTAVIQLRGSLPK